MLSAGSYRIPHDHPSLDGHFPGCPVVPGVVLLDHALALIAGHVEGFWPCGLEAVKFLSPVKPAQDIDVMCESIASDRLGFSCAIDGRIVLRGVARLREPAR